MVWVFVWCEYMLVVYGELGGLEVCYEWDVYVLYGWVVK